MSFYINVLPIIWLAA